MQNSRFEKFGDIHAIVIDSYVSTRKALKGILEKYGATNVLEFSDSQTAISELTKHTYINLVLMDINLTDSDAFEVLSFIRNRTVASDIPVVVVSGDASKGNIVKATDLGASDFIVKPFTAEGVAEKIASALEVFFSPSPFLKILRAADKTLLSNDVPSAMLLYQEALKIEPDSMRVKHAIALTLDRLGKTEESVALLQQCVQENPAYYKNYARLADLYIKRNQTPEAVEALVKELELNPKQSSRQVSLAKMLLERNDLDGAIARYRLALTEHSKNREAFVGLAKTYLQKQDLDKSLYYLKQFRKKYPQNSQPLRLALKFCLQSEQTKKAEEFLREETRRNPREADTYLLLSKLLLSEKKFKEAEKELSTLLRIDPNQEEAKKLMLFLQEQKSKGSPSGE